MTYLDRTFCASPRCTNQCGRKMTHSEEARKPDDAVVSYADFCRFLPGDVVYFVCCADDYYDPNAYKPDLPGSLHVDGAQVILYNHVSNKVLLKDYDDFLDASEIYFTPEDALIAFAETLKRKNNGD